MTLCVNGDASLQKQFDRVRNRPPRASFSLRPARTATTVMLTSTSLDPDGPIVGLRLGPRRRRGVRRRLRHRGHDRARHGPPPRRPARGGPRRRRGVGVPPDPDRAGAPAPVPGGAAQRGHHARGRARAAAGRACHTGCARDRALPRPRVPVAAHAPWLSEDGVGALPPPPAAAPSRHRDRDLRRDARARSASTRASASGAGARRRAWTRASCPGARSPRPARPR